MSQKQTKCGFPNMRGPIIWELGVPVIWIIVCWVSLFRHHLSIPGVRSINSTHVFKSFCSLKMQKGPGAMALDP